MPGERLLDPTHPPSKEEIIDFLGRPYGDQWATLDDFIQETYQAECAWRFYGSKNGWTLRYRKGGRPLCEITPEKGTLTVLIVLGSQEAADTQTCLDTFGPMTRECFTAARAFHDGRWLWLHIQETRDVEDVEKLLIIKRKPSKKKTKA